MSTPTAGFGEQCRSTWKGVVHTIAIPDPGRVVEPGLLSALTRPDEPERKQLRDVLDELMGDMCEPPGTAQIATDRLVEVPIPDGLVGQNVATDSQTILVDRIRNAIKDVPDELRLDELLALAVLLDGLNEDD